MQNKNTTLNAHKGQDTGKDKAGDRTLTHRENMRTVIIANYHMDN